MEALHTCAAAANLVCAYTSAKFGVGVEPTSASDRDGSAGRGSGSVRPPSRLASPPLDSGGASTSGSLSEHHLTGLSPEAASDLSSVLTVSPRILMSLEPRTRLVALRLLVNSGAYLFFSGNMVAVSTHCVRTLSVKFIVNDNSCSYLFFLW